LVVVGLQALLLPVYGFWAFIGAASSPHSSPWGFFGFVGVIWIVVTGLLAFWSRQGRTNLLKSAVAWALLAWLSIFLPLLLLWGRTRRVLVPPARQTLERWPTLYS
jgi:hypothetical protein